MVTVGFFADFTLTSREEMISKRLTGYKVCQENYLLGISIFNNFTLNYVSTTQWHVLQRCTLHLMKPWFKYSKICNKIVS